MSQEADLYNEGYYYYTGTNGYPLNYRKAFEYFKKAADLGVANAMNYLGLMYEVGKGVQQDCKTAAMWFAKAVQTDSENAYAVFNLGRMYYNGTGVEKDMVKAYQYCKAATLLGLGNTHSAYPRSCFLTGCILLEYYNNLKESYSYFVDAAKYGNIPEAWHNLGWLTEKGVVSVKESGKATVAERDGVAKGFYEKAAQLGYVTSMYDVGRLCVRYSQNQEARMWLEKAVANGYEPAKKLLKLFNVSQGGSIFGLFK